MPSKLPRVLRLPRVDRGDKSDSDFVLLHVSSSGAKPLDIKLIGTENTAVFAVSLKQSRIPSLKSKNAPCDDEEWNAILSFLLLGAPVGEESEDAVRNVEAVAKVDGEDTPMTIIFQKRIEGITQRLGILTLDPKDPDDEPVDIFEWCGVALETSSSSTHELDTLKHKSKTQEDQITALKRALDDLIKAKEAHDAEMLEKFALLLNEKKLKIRDQQRLLAGAKVDPDRARRVGENRSSEKPKPHQPLTSRAKKRKAAKDEIDEKEEKEDPDEKMDLDNLTGEPANDDDSELDRETEDERDQETEGSDLDADAAADTRDDAGPPRGLVGAAAEKTSRDGVEEAEDDAPAKHTRNARHVNEELAAPPPRREMPFATKKNNNTTKTSAPPPPPTDEGSETESADEL